MADKIDATVFRVTLPAYVNRRWLLPGTLLALHLPMFGYDLQHPDRFLNADRAGERIGVIQDFVRVWHAGGDLLPFVGSHGVGGDWLPQALLYLAGGQYLVILVQTLLALASVCWVRDIGVRLGLSSRTAQGAALLYGLLPHTLILPHQLSSEAIFVPLVVGSFALLAGGAPQRTWGWAGAGLLVGLATLVRPVTLLWPLLPLPRRSRTAYLLAACTPVLLWMLFIHTVSGEFSMGRSGHDLGRNLYGRAERIAASLHPPQPPVAGAHGSRVLSLGEYAAFALTHPGPTLAHSGRDLLVLGTKSGLERVLLDYLDVFPAQRKEIQNGKLGWRTQVEQQGLGAALLAIFQRNPALMLTAAGGALLISTLMLVAGLGARAWLRDGVTGGGTQEMSRLRLLLVAFPLYILLTAQSVDAAQSRHRAPAEFALCLLAAAGWSARRRQPLQTGHEN